jgi:DNA polymerase-4
VAEPEVIREALLALAGRTAGRMRRTGQAGRTVVLKVRLADFRTLSRSRTLRDATDVTHDVFTTAWALYEALNPGDRIRLVGVRVEGLTAAGAAPRQLSLDERSHGWREAERAADAAAARFGAGAVGPASLLRLRNPPGAPGQPSR